MPNEEPEPDSGEFSAALIFEVGDKKTDVSGALDYYQRHSILSSDGVYSAVTFHPNGNASPANQELSRPTALLQTSSATFSSGVRLC